MRSTKAGYLEQDEYQRDTDYLTARITADGRDGYPVEPDRYRLTLRDKKPRARQLRPPARIQRLRIRLRPERCAAAGVLDREKIAFCDVEGCPHVLALERYGGHAEHHAAAVPIRVHVPGNRLLLPPVDAAEVLVAGDAPRLLIVGSGPEEERLRRYAGELGPAPADIDVVIIGRPNVDEVDAASKALEERVDWPINPVVIAPSDWASAPTGFIRQIRKEPLYPLLEKDQGA
jgi:hypothetical protein